MSPSVFVPERRSALYCDFTIGSLMYLSTLYFASNAMLLGVLALIALSLRQYRIKSDILLVWAFALFAWLNLFLHIGSFDAAIHSSSFAVVLVALTAMLAPFLRVTALKVFVLLTCGEVLVGAYEYAIGQVALTDAQARMANQEISVESLLLYDSRVFGLSANSSMFAEKIFLSLLLIVAMPEMFERRAVPFLFIAVGLFLSFNRTAIAATLLLLLLLSTSFKWTWRTLVLGVGIITVFSAAVFANMDTLIFQFARGDGELSHSELSRLYFWQKALELLSEDPFFGNGSLTFRVEDFVTGLPQHTHNSLLMLFATHGVLVSLPLVAYIILRLSAANWRIVLAMFSFSLTQYFVFWNLSVPDIVLFYVLGRQAVRIKPGAKVLSAPQEAHPSGTLR